MRLPFAAFAYIPDEKIWGYALNEAHETGKHKARVFRMRLGITAARGEELVRAIRAAIEEEDVVFIDSSPYGSLYAVDFTMRTPVGEALVRTAWIIRNTEEFPRLTSCYVRK
jgi:hypothetical protein